jgi:dihydrofolate reductase
MRKLILQMQISVDGLAAAAKNADLKWQIWDWGKKWPWDETPKSDFNAVYFSVDTILLSRKMAKGGFIDHWTEAAVQFPADPFYKFAQRIVDIEKIIVTSKSMKSTWERTVVMKGELSREVQKLKRRKGKDIIAFGGVSFASALLAAGVVDELQFFVNPAAIGNGRSIFTGGVDGMRMRLTQSVPYDCGIVVNRYTPVSPRTPKRSAGR